MAIYFLPTIKREDYDAFRRIIYPDFPDSFEEWANELSKLAAQHLGQGSTARSIEVNPDEFVAYLARRRTSGSRHELYNFAFEKSGL